MYFVLEKFLLGIIEAQYALCFIFLFFGESIFKRMMEQLTTASRFLTSCISLRLDVRLLPDPLRLSGAIH